MILSSYLVVTASFGTSTSRRTSFNVTSNLQDGVEAEGAILRESLARFGATPPPTWLPPFPFEHVVLHEEGLKGTPDGTGRSRKAQEARNNHTIIKSLTRLRLLLSVVYLPVSSTILESVEKKFALYVPSFPRVSKVFESVYKDYTSTPFAATGY
ncbi:hypothetical protein KM043_015902 [Ampulex compressa]|nr:hypothetical protein KM043_015902 [Ampulex compressa]